MQQQQDKEFDARLREKMEDFKVSPPASLWEKIDEEVNGPVLKAKPGYGWLKIAASICLLAAAGVWLYRQQSPFRKDIVSIVGEQDTVNASPEPKVTIFNKSRSQDDAEKGTGTMKAGERDTGRGSDGVQPEAAEKAPGLDKAPKAKKAATSEKLLAGSGQASRLSAPSQVTERSQSQVAEANDRTGAENSGRTGDPVIARMDPLLEAVDPGSVREQSPGTERAAAEALAANAEAPAANPEDPAADAEELAAGAEKLAVNAADLASPEEMMPVRAETAVDGVVASAGMRRNEGEQMAPGLAEKRNAIVPKEIRELNGVGEALNMVASAIDRSEDKFIRIGKDEDSGKWNGLRLDLGLVTISYNRPEKKTQSEKN